MSFDLSGMPAKDDFMTANPTPPPPTPLTEEEIAARHINRIEKRLTRFFSQTGNGGNYEISIRTAGLSAPDKADLIAQVEAKGYGCVEDGAKMTITASP